MKEVRIGILMVMLITEKQLLRVLTKKILDNGRGLQRNAIMNINMKKILRHHVSVIII